MHLKIALAAVIIFLSWVQARANVSYDFTLLTVTGTVNNGEPLNFGTPILTVTNASVASGSEFFSEANRSGNDAAPYSDPTSGFVSFLTNTDLTFYNPDHNFGSIPETKVNLTFDNAGNITNGDININTDPGSGFIEYDLTLNDGTFTGVYGSDGNSACTGYPCEVTGTYSAPIGYSAVTVVSEPSSFAVLLVGMIGSVMVIQRNRRTRPRTP